MQGERLDWPWPGTGAAAHAPAAVNHGFNHGSCPGYYSTTSTLPSSEPSSTHHSFPDVRVLVRLNDSTILHTARLLKEYQKVATATEGDKSLLMWKSLTNVWSCNQCWQDAFTSRVPHLTQCIMMIAGQTSNPSQHYLGVCGVTGNGCRSSSTATRKWDSRSEDQATYRFFRLINSGTYDICFLWLDRLMQV